MAIRRYRDRLECIHQLIHRKATGDPEALAKKVGLSRSALIRRIREMKHLGAPIQYDRARHTYYYDTEVDFVIDFLPADGKRTGGGHQRAI